ncbi:hypothetical protein H8959_003318, partial [Pygathrix nigripes]
SGSLWWFLPRGVSFQRWCWLECIRLDPSLTFPMWNPGPSLIIQWQTREWTFLQPSVISCPRAPLTCFPALLVPVVWIATANGKAAPLTT